ncbi:L-2-hydroxyglutarate oxidase [Rhodococcus sp. X156]|uniref:L-2-hydroxyglutarate oxidase n=1 Tax=Rhodococcus sp. X156 TaxID=2499145 RepID=UPI000FDB3A09|nr:L-2-hydroxyglutarate oxidase [Rhodococcus sp. X156]
MHDYCVVGGGIVGLATALSLLQQRPGASLVLLEKEPALGRHQTGHNSGVIHSGLYYQPGSLKARLCRAGAQATKDFCARHDIPVRELGKLVVATTGREVAWMDALAERAGHNGITVARLDAAELGEREPAVAGLAALHVPVTASVDFTLVCAALRREVERLGGQVVPGAAVRAIAESATEVVVTAGEQVVSCRRLVVCGGLQADRLVALAGATPEARIVPFRGEYFQLPPHRRDVVSHLIYPVPDPDLPFLGVHLTPMVDGRVTVGPNAVLGLAREGYRRGSVDLADVRDVLGYAGFWNLARRNVRTGARELLGSASRRAFLAAARTYCPQLELADLQPHAAGIRAQAVRRDGALVHDFLLQHTARTLHVLNAPSPAATAALPIGRHVAQQCLAAEPA